MKKSILVFAAIALCGTTTMSAQARTSFGVKAEANMSNLIISDMPGYKSEFGVGAGLGGFVKIDFGEYFAIQPEVTFSWQNSKLKTEGVKNNFETWGMEIPAYAIGQLRLDTGDRAYIGIGPWARLGFSAKNTDTDTNYYKKQNGKRFMQPWDVGAAALVGYEFAFGMQINATYKFGMLNQLNDAAGDAYMGNQIITLGIGYRF